MYLSTEARQTHDFERPATFFVAVLRCAKVSVKACGKEKVNSNYEGWSFFEVEVAG
jgi:hypothetical protein